MKRTIALSAFGLISLFNIQNLNAAPLVEGEQNFLVREVSNSGLVIGNRVTTSTRGAVWNPESNIIDLLPLPADVQSSTVSDINTAGQVCGTLFFNPAVFPLNIRRAALWTGPGSIPQNLGASNAPDDDGYSECIAINNLGTPVGNSQHCRAGEAWNGSPFGCGTHPMSGVPFSILGSEPTSSNREGETKDINDSGQVIGKFWNPSNNSIGQRILQNGSALTDVGFTVKRITNNGTVYGDTGSFVKMRSPSGTESTIPCGSFFLDANEYGDVLTYTAGPDNIRVWHDGKCDYLSDVLPEGSPAYTFPSQTNAGAVINDSRKIAANVKKPGIPVNDVLDYFVIFFTPKYVNEALPTATPQPTAPSENTAVATPVNTAVATAVGTAAGTPEVTQDPSEQFVLKIANITAILKTIKAKFPKTQKTEQTEIKTALKNAAADLLNHVTANKASIATSSAKIDLTKLAKAVKTAIGKVTQRKDSFNDDKKAASKAIKNLLKGVGQ